MRFWICDVNGVLIDSVAIVREAFAATAARYRFSLSERQFQAIKGVWLFEAYRILDPGGDASARRAFHLQYVHDRVADLRAFPGVSETLMAAKRMGVQIGVTTSHGHIAEACLVKTGLYSFVDCLVTQEEITRTKPHPDSILRTLSLLGADVDDDDLKALHIGDTAEDIKAGRAAGVSTIGSLYGVSSEAEIRAAGPDYVIEAFDEMWAWLPSPGSSEPGLEVAREGERWKSKPLVRRRSLSQ